VENPRENQCRSIPTAGSITPPNPQGREFYQVVFGIGAMHGLAIVSQSFLREPLRVADNLGAFRPRVTVAVERYAFDAHLAAAFFSAVRRGIFVEP
jgi:hypothetical protein